MESTNLQNGSKSISLYNLEKNENILSTKTKKPKQQSSKCSLSRKKTNNSIIKNIFDEKKLTLNSKVLNETPNIKKNKISSNLKANYSISKIKNIRPKDIDSLLLEQKRVYTINIQLDSNTKNFLKKTKIQKKYYLKNNGNTKSKSNKKINNDKSKKKNEKLKKIVNLSITPQKKTTNNINSFKKEKNNLLILNLSQNSENNKIIENSKNKFSRSVIEQPKHLPNNANTIINTYNYINTNNNNNIIHNNNNNNNIESNNCKNDDKKILVIDLDETLIHTSFEKVQNPDLTIQLDSNINKKNNINNNKNDIPLTKSVEAYIRIRPGVDQLLSQMSKYYDIYVYSASSKNYLNTIIKNIDKNNIIKQCYCRDDCIIYVEDYEEDFDKPNNKYKYIKDLKKINKELRNIVFIDNNTISFKLQEKNGIPIKSWYGDYEDLELYKLIPILKNLSGFYDVRVEISKFVQNKTFIWSKSINWLIENCLNSSYLNEINSVLLKEQKKPEFHFCNYYDMNINRPRVINNINNILINLNEDNNNFENDAKYIKKIKKKKSLLKKINTEMDFKANNYKNIKVYKNNSDINNENKFLFIDNKSPNNKNAIINKNRFSNSNCSQKIKKNLFKKKIVKPNQFIKNTLAQYSLCFSKNNIKEENKTSEKKQSLKKTNKNNSKIINKYLHQNQNRVIVNYINNKKEH